MIFALFVCRNEEHRYLESFLANTRQWADKMFCFDDNSTDRTPLICAKWCDGVALRAAHPEVPPLVQDEGLFRGGAWSAFEEYMAPVEGDWVFTLDCDQMLITTNGMPVHQMLNSLTGSPETKAVEIQIPEVFGYDTDGTPLVRIDGFWGMIRGPQFFRYLPGGEYPPARVGPAQPSYVYSPAVPGHWLHTEDLKLIHFGYAREEDQKVKYHRYTVEMADPSHRSDHVESIIAPDKQLVRWSQPIPNALVRKD